MSPSFSSFVSANILTIGPFMSLFAIVQELKPPESIATQTWILTAIGAAMGLVKIALWLRNQGKDGGDSSRVTTNEQNIAILTENDKRLSENQQKLAVLQDKALDNHAKMLEALTLLKYIVENQENNMKSFL